MLYRRLKSDGYEVWIDEKSIIPGQDWKFEIQTGIRNANVIIFCLSSISVVKEGYVQVEIKEAGAQRLVIDPINKAKSAIMDVQKVQLVPAK